MENGYIEKDYKSIIKFAVNKFDFYRKYMGLKRMDVYIIRKFLGTFFFALGLILLIVVVFDISERIEKFIEYKAPLKEIVFGYYMNFLPYFANVFSPLFTFIAVIFFTSKLATDTEIIALLSTGVSFRRILRPYIVSASVIAVLSFLLGAFIIPNANQKRIVFQKKYMGKNFVNKQDNIHLQLADTTYVYMSRFSVGSKVGYDFSIENFADNVLKSKLISSKVEWDEDNKKWRIHNWKMRKFDGYKEEYTTGERLDTVLAFSPSELSEDPKRIKEQLTLPELEDYIDKMKLRGNSNVVEFQIEKYKMGVNAFATFILTVIGVSVSARKARGGMGWHLGVGLFLSFSYILFMQFSTVFAVNGGMNPLLAVWIPNILFTFVAAATYKTAPR